MVNQFAGAPAMSYLPRSTNNCGDVAVEFEPNLKIARILWQSDVSLEALRREYRKFRCFPEVAELKGVIIDFSQARDVRLSSGDVSSFSQEVPIFPAGFPRVFIGAKDLHFGLLRMYEIMSGEPRHGTIVVHTLSEAYVALGITGPVFQPSTQR
jgi:hypothetical protein